MTEDITEPKFLVLIYNLGPIHSRFISQVTITKRYVAYSKPNH